MSAACRLHPPSRRSPLRGAWIEILLFASKFVPPYRRSPLRGAWIEIYSLPAHPQSPLPVAPPCGERGLKFRPSGQRCGKIRRSPLRGAWIEIYSLIRAFAFRIVAPPCGERGLKSPPRHRLYARPRRRSPLRGAWIEISAAIKSVSLSMSSLPLAGSVD